MTLENILVYHLTRVPKRESSVIQMLSISEGQEVTMNEIKTRYGSFIPYSGEVDLRKKNKEPVTYHENGEIESSNFGFDLTEDGKLKSVEPAFGEKLMTKNGMLYPFDTESYRLSAENNSLMFDEKGDIVKVKTLKTGLKVSIENGIKNLKACMAQDPLTGFPRLFPLELYFNGDIIEVTCLDKIRESFPLEAVEFES